jgi:hypothetical protein
MSLSKIAGDITTQFVGGALIGTLTDRFFENKAINDSTVLVAEVKILGQFIVDSFLTYSYFEMLIKENIQIMEILFEIRPSLFLLL